MTNEDEDKILIAAGAPANYRYVIHRVDPWLSVSLRKVGEEWVLSVSDCIGCEPPICKESVFVIGSLVDAKHKVFSWGAVLSQANHLSWWIDKEVEKVLGRFLRKD